MRDRFILIYGSASYSCPETKLDRAIEFVKGFVSETLKRGGGLVVLGVDEASTEDPSGKPHTFDWIVLREVQRFVESTSEAPRICARIVMSDQAIETKFDDKNLTVLSKLEQRGVLEVERIRREEYTGGRYRQIQLEVSDAMLAIGGGKGTYICGTDMLEVGKPVLPMDLRLGSSSEDGEGAVLLHREFTENPGRFFRSAHAEIADKIETLSLEREIHQVSDIAQRATELLSLELGRGEPIPRQGIKKVLGFVDGAVGRVAKWVGLARAIEFIRNLL